MAFGCLASLAFYIVVALLLNGALPVLVVGAVLVGAILLVNYGLRSEWPLY